LRIAHLTATLPPYPGGAGNTAHRFAVEQAARGHEVEVFTAPAPGHPPSSGGAVVHRIHPLLAIGNAPLIPRLARIEGFDVVHIHYPFIFGSELTLLGRLRAASRRQALLVHYKNRLVANGARGALFEAYERTVAPALIRAADRVCVLSPDHARSVSYLRRTLERDPAKLVEMPNGVDAELFSPGVDSSGWRERLGIGDEELVAVFVATLDRAHHFKRVDVAIDAIAELKGGVHLVVAGDGDLVDSFRARAAARGVGNRVHFVGAVPHPELPDVLRAADVFVLTTEPPESFGIVLIEAMATGLPVVATEYPGVRAVVVEGETGLLAPRGDAAGVATRLRELVAAGPEGRRAMGEAGRERAEREWNWPRLVERMDRAYAEAIVARTAKMS
jgi:glycosyltransferase involved in cell wall biosynthesis